MVHGELELAGSERAGEAAGHAMPAGPSLMKKINKWWLVVGCTKKKKKKKKTKTKTTKTQKHKNTKTQKHKNTKTQKRCWWWTLFLRVCWFMQFHVCGLWFEMHFEVVCPLLLLLSLFFGNGTAFFSALFIFYFGFFFDFFIIFVTQSTTTSSHRFFDFSFFAAKWSAREGGAMS